MIASLDCSCAIWSSLARWMAPMRLRLQDLPMSLESKTTMTQNNDSVTSGWTVRSELIYRPGSLKLCWPGLVQEFKMLSCSNEASLQWNLERITNIVATVLLEATNKGQKCRKMLYGNLWAVPDPQVKQRDDLYLKKPQSGRTFLFSRVLDHFHWVTQKCQFGLLLVDLVSGPLQVKACNLKVALDQKLFLRWIDA